MPDAADAADAAVDTAENVAGYWRAVSAAIRARAAPHGGTLPFIALSSGLGSTLLQRALVQERMPHHALALPAHHDAVPALSAALLRSSAVATGSVVLLLDAPRRGDAAFDAAAAALLAAVPAALATPPRRAARAPRRAASRGAAVCGGVDDSLGDGDGDLRAEPSAFAMFMICSTAAARGWRVILSSAGAVALFAGDEEGEGEQAEDKAAGQKGVEEEGEEEGEGEGEGVEARREIDMHMHWRLRRQLDVERIACGTQTSKPGPNITLTLALTPARALALARALTLTLALAPSRLACGAAGVQLRFPFLDARVVRARRALLLRSARHVAGRSDSDTFREVAARLLLREDNAAWVAEPRETVAVAISAASATSAASAVPPHAPFCPLHDPSHRFVAAGAFERSSPDPSPNPSPSPYPSPSSNPNPNPKPSPNPNP